MKGLLLRGIAVSALVAAVAVPTATAKPSAVRLSVLPLPASSIGSAAKSLPLQHDSGVVTDTDAARYALGITTANAFATLGRQTGYDLNYGIGASGGSGITEVSTDVDKYVTTRGAKQGLLFWKSDDPKITQLDQGGFAVSSAAMKVPAVGGSRFAFLASFSATNITPVFIVDEQFTQGDYEADVTVWAGTAAAAKSLAPKLAKALDARIKEALAGKLRAKPVKLPAKQVEGPPRGGPDLTPLVLKTTDLSGTATVSDQGYILDPQAISDYGVLMAPAGPWVVLDQEIEWYATANQAAFEADYALATTAGPGTSFVDLSDVGDGAQGVITTPPTGNFGVVVFSTGKLAEFIELGSASAVQPSDVQSTAQTAANYINSAGLGS